MHAVDANVSDVIKYSLPLALTMTCCITQPRIPTEELTLEISLEGHPEKFEVTWGELWKSQPGWPLQLNDSEKWWRDRYRMLERRGYRLLPRYSPDWKPSWIKPYDSDPEETGIMATYKADKYEDTVEVHPSSPYRARTNFCIRYR